MKMLITIDRTGQTTMDILGGAGTNCSEISQPYVDRMSVGEPERHFKPEFEGVGDDVERVHIGGGS